MCPPESVNWSKLLRDVAVNKLEELVVLPWHGPNMVVGEPGEMELLNYCSEISRVPVMNKAVLQIPQWEFSASWIRHLLEVDY